MFGGHSADICTSLQGYMPALYPPSVFSSDCKDRGRICRQTCKVIREINFQKIEKVKEYLSSKEGVVVHFYNKNNPTVEKMPCEKIYCCTMKILDL